MASKKPVKKSAFSSAFANNYFNTSQEPQAFSAFQSPSVYDPFNTKGVVAPKVQSPQIGSNQSSFANFTPDDYNYGGYSADAPLAATQFAQGDVPLANPNTGSSLSSMWNDFQNWSSRPDRFSDQEWNAMNADQKIKAGALPTGLQSMLGNIGAGVNIASGLYGLYGTYKNQQNTERQMDNAATVHNTNEKNRMATASAFGSNYTPAYIR